MSPLDALGLSPKHAVADGPNGTRIILVTPAGYVASQFGTNPVKVTLTAQQYEGYLRWKFDGELIQNAMPTVSVEDREALMSGLTAERWNKWFPNKDDE